jgi:hypothetical protein
MSCFVMFARGVSGLRDYPEMSSKDLKNRKKNQFRPVGTRLEKEIATSAPSKPGDPRHSGPPTDDLS